MVSWRGRALQMFAVSVGGVLGRNHIDGWTSNDVTPECFDYRHPAFRIMDVIRTGRNPMLID